MVFIRAAEAKDIPSLQTLFLQLGYQTETAILAQRITAPQRMMSALVAETENAVCGVIVINFMKITATRRFANASLNICLNRLRARAFPG